MPKYSILDNDTKNVFNSVVVPQIIPYLLNEHKYSSFIEVMYSYVILIHKDISDIFNINLIKVYRLAGASTDYFAHKVNLLNHQIVDALGEILNDVNLG